MAPAAPVAAEAQKAAPRAGAALPLADRPKLRAAVAALRALATMAGKLGGGKAPIPASVAAFLVAFSHILTALVTIVDGWGTPQGIEAADEIQRWSSLLAREQGQKVPPVTGERHPGPVATAGLSPATMATAAEIDALDGAAAFPGPRTPLVRVLAHAAGAGGDDPVLDLLEPVMHETDAWWRMLSETDEWSHLTPRTFAPVLDGLTRRIRGALWFYNRRADELRQLRGHARELEARLVTKGDKGVGHA